MGGGGVIRICEHVSKILGFFTCVSTNLSMIVERVDLRRALRVGAWIRRLVHDCRNAERKSGPITTKDVITERSWWIRRVQERVQNQLHLAKLAEELGCTNADNLLVCHRRIQGQYQCSFPESQRLQRS